MKKGELTEKVAPVKDFILQSYSNSCLSYKNTKNIKAKIT